MTLCGKTVTFKRRSKRLWTFFYFFFVFFIGKDQRLRDASAKSWSRWFFFMFTAPFVRGIGLSPYKSCPHLLCHVFLLFYVSLRSLYLLFFTRYPYKHVHIVLFFPPNLPHSLYCFFPPLLSCLSRVGAHWKSLLNIKCIQNAGMEQWEIVRMLLTMCVLSF